MGGTNLGRNQGSRKGFQAFPKACWNPVSLKRKRFNPKGMRTLPLKGGKIPLKANLAREFFKGMEE